MSEIGAFYRKARLDGWTDLAKHGAASACRRFGRGNPFSRVGQSGIAGIVGFILANQTALATSTEIYFPVLDGTVLPLSPVDAFSSGRFNRVPILTGLTADEQGFFLPEVTGGAVLTSANFYGYVNSFGAQYASTLLARYPLGSYASPSH